MAQRFCDIIERKANGHELTESEIAQFVEGFCSGEIPDYQAAAFIMAVYINGMNATETAQLTDAMARSGDMLDLSGISGVKVDKHSTGGIGDKTTMILAPIIAACGGKIAKMSGRGLGFGGGTIDKLESIPSFNIALSEEAFIRNVNEIGLAVTGQTANVAPADKKIYAIRDVTGTANSVPLIASSIMSKKLASGADKFVLDVKVGSGAFFKDLDAARAVARLMVQIGEHHGKETVAILTRMDRPLGRYVGNLLEVMETAETLRGEGPADLTEVCLVLVTEMLTLAGKGTRDVCRARAEQSLHDGSAYKKFLEFIGRQGGNADVLEHPWNYYEQPCSIVLQAQSDGYFDVVNAEEIGRATVVMGAGRAKKDDKIDYTAGIVFHKAVGDAVRQGETLCEAFAADAEKLKQSVPALRHAITLRKSRADIADRPLIYERIDRNS